MSRRQQAGSNQSAANRAVPLLLCLALIGLAAAGFSLYKAYQENMLQQQYQSNLSRQQVLSAQIRAALSEGQGVNEFAPKLDEMESSIRQLRATLPPDEQASAMAVRVGKAFDNFKAELPQASDSESADSSSDNTVQTPPFMQLVESTGALRSHLARIDSPLPQVESAGHLFQLAVSVDKKVEIAGESIASVESVRGPWLVFDQILKRLEAMLATGEIASTDAEVLIADIRSQHQSLSGILDGTRPLPVTELPAPEPVAADTAPEYAVRHNLLDDTLDATSAAVADLASQVKNWVLLGLLTALVSAAILGLLCLWLWRRMGSHRQQREVQERRQQESILKLLDEISALAEGDLTTRATVTEEFTGSIADSVNYAVTELRRLVGAILNSADRVTVAVEETGTTAQQLATASAAQSREISRSSSYLKAMSDTMKQVSLRSAEARDIAARSVELASSGRDAVTSTETGMSEIRARTANTKRVLKRLGDSSLQIGRTVDLINEVSEKTRLLAMNAAIQANVDGADSPVTRAQPGLDQTAALPSAHNAARVADQVQTLSSTLSHSASEIRTLVAVIQQDVSTAIASMEDTNKEVQGVSRLAVHADECLAEIQTVSDRLSAVVNYLSGRVQRQSQVVSQLSGNMGVINEVTQHSAHGLRLSATALEDLRLMANELRDGVADFSLPASDREAIAKRSAAINGRLTDAALRQSSSKASGIEPVSGSTAAASTASPTVSSATRPGITKRSVVLDEIEMTQVIEPPSNLVATDIEGVDGPGHGKQGQGKQGDL